MALNDVFRALADPTRREILKLLRSGEMSAGELAKKFDMSKPSMSHHFTVLKQADLVTTRRDGQQIIYALNTTVMEDLAAILWDSVRRRRPVTRREGTPLMKRWILLSSVLTIAEAAVMAYLGLARSDHFLAKIPVHWNADMVADAWTTPDKYVWYLLISPGIMLLMTLLMIVLPWLSPKNFEIEPFAGTFGYVMTVLVVFFGYIGGLLLWVGLEENPPYWNQCFVASFFVLFAVMGNVMGKVKRNFWMGIRTPWTLASETVWNRTHRVAAWSWVLAGLVGGVLVLVGLPFWIALALLMTAALWPVVYSLVLYKSLEKHGQL